MKMKKCFNEVSMYIAPVPTYIGGFMAFGWATNKHSDVSLEELKARAETIQNDLKYYTPEVHLAAFALPHEFRTKLSN
jgi:spermidine synthase